MTKTRTLYEIREFTGHMSSVQLGRRLRTRKEKSRVVKMLKKQGRDVMAWPTIVNLTDRQFARVERLS
jgi:hypothetical protein